MKLFKSSIILLMTVFTVACAGSSSRIEVPISMNKEDKVIYKIINQASAPEKAINILKPHLDARLNESGIQADSPDQADKLIEITLTIYRMRMGHRRALLGSMAGSDRIQSTVVVRDIKSQSVVGRYSVYSKNATAVSSSKALIQGHADEIVNKLIN